MTRRVRPHRRPATAVAWACAVLVFSGAACGGGAESAADESALADPAAVAAEFEDAATTATAVSGQDDDEIDLFDATQLRGEPVNQYDLDTGDCFNRFETLRAGRKVVVTTQLDCEEPHQYEVFHRFEYDAPHPAIFPGEEVMTEFALQGCYHQFEAFVGLGYELSVYDIGVFTPNRSNFEDSRARYRGITCWLYRIDDQEIAGTARATAI